MELKAVLKKIHPTVSRNGYDSRKIWLTLDPQGKYPQTIEVEAGGKMIGAFDGIQVGAWVTLQVDLRGREWTNKEGATFVFNTISVWKVAVAGNEVNMPKQEQQPAREAYGGADVDAHANQAPQTTHRSQATESDGSLPF